MSKSIEDVISDITTDKGVEREVVEKSINSNGFFNKDSLDAEEVNLVDMHVDYLEAMEDVKEQRRNFKYTDGEESIDKNQVFDQFRRYANDLLGMYNSARRSYDSSRSGLNPFFTVRGRAGVLDERTRR